MTAPLPITPDQIERMKRMEALGMTTRSIAEAFGIGEQRASEFITGRKKRHREYRGKPKPESKEVTVAHNVYEAIQLKRRGFSLLYIAAKTRLPYKEIAAL